MITKTSLALLVCMLALSTLSSRSQDVDSAVLRRTQIGVFENSICRLTVPEKKIAETMTKALRAGCTLSRVSIEASGFHTYLTGECLSGGSKGMAAIEIDNDGSRLFLSYGSETVICLAETCPGCRFRKDKTGKIITCQCEQGAGEGHCSFRMDKDVAGRFIELFEKR